jgi:hypothetical protein
MNPNLTACEKVAARYPKSKLKQTLYWLATHADHDDGTNCWCSIETLARERCVSERTIQRHLRKLEEKGDVITLFMKSGYRTNLYSIPICKDVSPRQCKLPLAQRDNSVTSVDNFGQIVTLPGGFVLKKRRQNVTQPLVDLNILKSGKGRVTKLTESEDGIHGGESFKGSISAETQAELNSLVQSMSVSLALGAHSGRKTTLTPDGMLFAPQIES